MEGRWLSLTQEALVTGALDYSEICEGDQASLLKETLVHNELSRRRHGQWLFGTVLCDILGALDGSQENAAARGILRGLLDHNALPWEAKRLAVAPRDLRKTYEATVQAVNALYGPPSKQKAKKKKT